MNVIPCTKQMYERHTGQSEACVILIWKRKKIGQRSLLYKHIPVKLVSGNWFSPMLLLEFSRTAKANVSLKREWPRMMRRFSRGMLGAELRPIRTYPPTSWML